MSDARTVIAQVLREHGFHAGIRHRGCKCGWALLEPHLTLIDHPAHVAAEIDTALGGLTHGSDAPTP